MSNIGPGLHDAGEAASDPDWDSPEDGKGMTPDDATESAFNDWDEKTHGISEASRTEWGPELKKVADLENTNVRDGINGLVQQHIAKRHGSPETKRQALGQEIDFYQINPMPTAEAAPQADGVSYPGTGQVIQTEEHAGAVIQDFVAQNPIAQDGEIQEAMISVAQDMRAKGYAPNLDVMLQHAVAQDPRYSEQARHAQDADQVARAKAASVQVSGGANSAGSVNASDEIDDIIREMV